MNDSTSEVPVAPVCAAWKRCPTCDRWGGERKWDAALGAVVVSDDKVRGVCQGGPWHGTLRGIRNACGRWLVWAVVPEAQRPEEM